MADFPEGRLIPTARAQFARREVQPSIKRIFDVVGSVVLIVFLSPLMFLIAAVLYTQIGPSIVFGHVREGRNRQKFKCLKFRTMYLDADARLEQILKDDPAAREEWRTSRKLKGDPRILPVVGSVLRKTSLDELPQLFNVLSGDMSLVGPRPVVEDEIRDFYGEVASLYYSVRPGMTGPWQIGDRSDDDYASRVAKDANYVIHWSIWGDVVILAKTLMLLTKIKGNGAY